MLASLVVNVLLEYVFTPLSYSSQLCAGVPHQIFQDTVSALPSEVVGIQATVGAVGANTAVATGVGVAVAVGVGVTVAVGVGVTVAVGVGVTVAVGVGVGTPVLPLTSAWIIAFV